MAHARMSERGRHAEYIAPKLIAIVLLCCVVIFFYGSRRPSNQLGGLSIGPNSHPNSLPLLARHGT